MKPGGQMLRVAIVMELSDHYDRGIATGLVRYANDCGSIQLFGHGWMFSHVDDLSTWEGNGVVARVARRSDANRLYRMGIPIVDVAGAFDEYGFDRVTADDEAIGNMAAQHFVGRGLSRFAYCGVAGVLWSKRREAGFRGALNRAVRRGVTDDDDAGCAHGSHESSDTSARGDVRVSSTGYRMPASRPPKTDIPAGSLNSVFARPLDWWEQLADSDDLEWFLRHLPQPVGVFAANDSVALRVLRSCRATGLRVPDQVAVVGVDNEDITCELADPALSSVSIDLRTIGYEAGRVLADRLGRRLGREAFEITVPPGRVVERDSSRVIATEDPAVRRALATIRLRGAERIGVDDIVSTVDVGRRSLEQRFRRETGRTILQAIHHTRALRSADLLRDTNRTMEAIATDVGFGSVQRFYRVFRETYSMTPGEFRMRARGNSDCPTRLTPADRQEIIVD